MFLKITNKGTVSRKYYELIGATNKRGKWDDPNIIGNKGSGAKLAPIPALRLGLEVAVSSSDVEGDYILKYETQKADLGNQTTEQIVFHYVGNGSFPSQLTTEAFQDWDKPIGDDKMKIFKAFREYIVNAWDEDKNFILEEVEEITQANISTTSVYITLTDEIREILTNLSRYFKILNGTEPLFSYFGEYSQIKKGDIYPKSDDSVVTRLFSQGVLVNCKNSDYYSTTFDYSLDDKDLLSEERIIKDFSKFVEGIGQMLAKLNDPEMIFQLFKALVKNDARLELQALGSLEHISSDIASLWRQVWKQYFGAKAVITANRSEIDLNAKDKGWTVINSLTSTFRNFLLKCGITNAADVVPTYSILKDQEEKPKFEEISLDSDQKKMFDEAYVIFLRYYSDAHKLPVYFYRPIDWTWKDAGGYCGKGDREFKEIWIAEKSLVSIKQILIILVHEGRHCLKKAGDYDRNFTQAADDQLVDMMLANPVPPVKNIWEAGLISARGILIPKRFIGQSVHVLVDGMEFRLKIGTGDGVSIMSSRLLEPIKGNVSQQRIVSKFQKLGCVSLPPSIIGQLPQQLTLEIR